ncbi:hypothetical protein LTR36_005652 [Oleoguttula mirabilis]|uniref:F-box domain-containing protein n=1 Tax=Oleoguttula mirabilis TaxID=1507867 RepID=A0AAV9JDM4_9PEZI|nr:hypothetical protein LTR36_005652 [Oleoguttula mirabilis]
MAAQRVFDVGELAENILLRLPLRDILVASQINSVCSNAATAALTIRQRLLREQMPQMPAVLDHKPKKAHMAAYNTSKNPNHCWWFLRLALNATTTMFLLRERRRVFWFLGKRDGTRGWMMLRDATVEVTKYDFEEDLFDLQWRSSNGVVVWKAQVDNSSTLMQYLDAFHREEMEAVY